MCNKQSIYELKGFNLMQANNNLDGRMFATNKITVLRLNIIATKILKAIITQPSTNWEISNKICYYECAYDCASVCVF